MWFLLFLILAIILFGAGFLLKVLWYAAVLALIIALIGYIAGRRSA